MFWYINSSHSRLNSLDFWLLLLTFSYFYLFQEDISPRSDDDLEMYKGALENPYDLLLRNHTIFKDEFILAESRPKDPFIQTSSSGSDTVSSSSSSHMSTPRDKKVSKDAKTSSKSEKSLSQGQSNNSVSTKNVSLSLNISKQKLNNKSIPTAKETGDSGKDVSVLRAMAMKNAAVMASHGTNKSASSDNKTKTSVSNRKSGGTIIIHGDIENKNEIEVKEKVGSNKVLKDHEKQINETRKLDQSAKDNTDQSIQGSAVGASKITSVNTNSVKEGHLVAKTDTAKSVKSAKDNKTKTVSKTGVPLQVVPTKLTANAIRNVPKPGIDKTDDKSVTVKTENDTTKKVRENTDTNKCKSEQQTLSNVKMELSPSAQIVNRVVKSKDTQNREENRDSETVSVVKSETVETTTNKNVNDKQQSVTTDNNVSLASNSKTENEKSFIALANKNKASNSAQPGNRQINVQPRNANFNVSKSAGAYQRAATTTRKSTPSYTPRFTSLTAQNTSNEVKSSDNNVLKSAKPIGKPSTEKSVTNIGSKAVDNSDSKSEQCEEKGVKPSSPSDINLAPGVCKTSSMLKSYNMASSSNGGNKSVAQPRTPRSNIRATPVSDPKDQSSSSQQINRNTLNNENKSKEPLSKSTISEGSAKVSSVNLVSRSVSQISPVGNITKEKSGSAGISRSISMSMIEESAESNEEKKKMSSSDTKVQNIIPKSSGKQRPLSDGPVGATNNTALADKMLKSNGKAPLIDILPNASPRIAKANYLEPSQKLSTPVIVNPFEELEQNREKENQLKLGTRGITATEFGFVVEKAGPERSKTQSSLKARNLKSGKKPGYGKDVKPSSASTRGSSAKSKRTKSKESKPDDSAVRPKSGKGVRRVRSGKRKRKIPSENLSKQNEKSDVALIGGIGWHVATSCLDKSDVDAVVVSQIDSSDSSDAEVDVVRINSPLTLDIPQALNVPIPLEISSAVSSPRFMEVKPSLTEKPVLPVMENDGFPPMNLDMTQASKSLSKTDSSKENEVGSVVPEDIAALLAKLKAQENAENLEDNDESTANTYQQLTSAIHREILMGKLTPIPESPNITGTQSSLRHVAKTVEAITKFDKNLKEDDLNRLLGVTPRDQSEISSIKEKPLVGQEHRKGIGVNVSQSPGALSKRLPVNVNSDKTVQSNNGMVQSTSDNFRAGSRNSSSKNKPHSNRQTPVSSADKKERNLMHSNKATPVSSADINVRSVNSKKGLSFSLKNEKQGVETIETNKSLSLKQDNASNKSAEHEKVLETKIENKERKLSAASLSSEGKSESIKLDLKTLLTEKMQSTKRMLEETTNSLKSRSWRNKRKISVGDTENITVRTMETKEFEMKEKMDDSDVVNMNGSDSDTPRGDSEVKTSRSSRKERKFSETKTSIPDDENIDVVINEILSNTYPSTKSKSAKSANSTLTEADKHLLLQMANNKEASPFYAKENVRESSSYDDSVTLNSDNPQLMKRFHADKFQMGRKVKAMIDAGADKTKVKAMMGVDNEAKQLARIMNSFRHMELYAGPQAGISNRSARKETPRKAESLKRIDQNQAVLSSVNKPIGRPGSAGAGRLKPGRFTEIKEGSTSVIATDRAVSPLAVPQVSTCLLCFGQLSESRFCMCMVM